MTLDDFLVANHSVLNDFQKKFLKETFSYLEDYRPAASHFEIPGQRVLKVSTIESSIVSLLEEAEMWSKTSTPSDGNMVVEPAHYNRMPIEPTYFITMTRLDHEWLEGNTIKYVCRYPHKNGREDLLKAARNLEMLKLLKEGHYDWNKARQKPEPNREPTSPLVNARIAP